MSIARHAAVRFASMFGLLLGGCGASSGLGEADRAPPDTEELEPLRVTMVVFVNADDGDWDAATVTMAATVVRGLGEDEIPVADAIVSGGLEGETQPLEARSPGRYDVDLPAGYAGGPFEIHARSGDDAIDGDGIFGPAPFTATVDASADPALVSWSPSSDHVNVEIWDEGIHRFEVEHPEDGRLAVPGELREPGEYTVVVIQSTNRATALSADASWGSVAVFDWIPVQVP